MLISNFHTHTERCHHAIGQDEEFVLAAIEAGIKVLGFSEHVEIGVEGFFGLDSGIHQLKNYVASINKLKEKYKDKIEIHIGLEGPYATYGQDGDIYKKFAQYGIEYCLLGQHELFDELGNQYYILSHPVTKSAIKQYTKKVCEGIRSNLFAYVAHPELFLCGINEIDEDILSSFREICKTAKEYNTPLEINVSGFFRNEKLFYPNEEFLKIAKEENNEVIIGLDAHNINMIKHSYYLKGEKLAEKYGLTLLKTIDFHKLDKYRK